MTELTSVKIKENLIDGLCLKFPNMSLNEIFTELASDRNRRSRKIYRDEDILYAIEQLQGYRKNNPLLSLDEIFRMIQEYHENNKKNK
jgi:hypothetical protein